MIRSYDLADRAGITYRQLDYWTRQGYLTAVESTPGPGTFRTYDETQLTIARGMAHLVKAGLTVQAAHQAALELAVDGRAHLGDFLLQPNSSND